MGAGFKGSPEPGFAPRHRTPGPPRPPLWAERAGGEGPGRAVSHLLP